VVGRVRLTRGEWESLEEVTQHQRGEARLWARTDGTAGRAGESISSIARHMGRWTYRGLPLVS